MSTHELYTIPAEHRTWDVAMDGSARFTWEYDDGRDRLLSLYQKGRTSPQPSSARGSGTASGTTGASSVSSSST